MAMSEFDYWVPPYKVTEQDYKEAKLSENDFYSTLRNKLLWGMDKRN